MRGGKVESVAFANVPSFVLARGVAAAGVEVDEPTSPDGSPDFLTAMLADPDGTRIELVQWPTGHADGMSAEDFSDEAMTSSRDEGDHTTDLEC